MNTAEEYFRENCMNYKIAVAADGGSMNFPPGEFFKIANDYAQYVTEQQSKEIERLKKQLRRDGVGVQVSKKQIKSIKCSKIQKRLDSLKEINESYISQLDEKSTELRKKDQLLKEMVEALNLSLENIQAFEKKFNYTASVTDFIEQTLSKYIEHERQH